jgi:NADPH:quinone reductase-like Zn-dependent oxidoreductase
VTGLLLDWLRGALTKISFGLGSLAEYVVLSIERVVRAPASLDYAEAATLPCAALTAWNAIHGGDPVGKNSKVLVLGSGGVSLFAMLFARAAGARTIATSSQDTKLNRWLALGVSEGINYRDNPDWGKAVFDRTGGVNKVGTGTLSRHSITVVKLPCWD